MELPLLYGVVVVFALSVVVVFLCHLAKIPTIVGFLLTGLLAGPHALGVVESLHEVEVLAEIGVLLLLFTIGVEFSLQNLLRAKRSVLLGGSLQVFLTIAGAVLLGRLAGLGLREAIFVGFLLSMSSTSIMLKFLQDRAEIDSPHGRTALAISIFQDTAAVPMVLLIPFLAGGENGLAGIELAVVLLKGLGLIAAAIASARWVVPWTLYQIARTRSRELFVLSVVVICFAVAWLTARAGLSLALGAFLAGLIVSESEYSQQALGDIIPLRDVFTSLFFVSIGMLFDIRFVLGHVALVLVLILVVAAIKALLAGIATVALGFPLPTVISVALALSNIGEFSFILSRSGIEYGLLDEMRSQVFLAVSVATMAATPFLIAAAPRLSRFLMRMPLPTKLKTGFVPVRPTTETTKLTDHLVIVGFGLNGRNVARAAAEALIPYVVIEMNPETVRAERSKGEDIHYGDAANRTVLEHAGIMRAHALVVAISDASATRGVVALARRLNHAIHIIARTRFLSDMRPLYELGADEVIPEEFETSVEIFARVLRRFRVPSDQIERFVGEIRADGYEMLRSLSGDEKPIPDLTWHLPDTEVRRASVTERSALVGRTIAQIGMRTHYGVTILAIRRGEQVVSNPHGEELIRAGDVLVLLGPPDKVSGVIKVL